MQIDWSKTATWRRHELALHIFRRWSQWIVPRSRENVVNFIVAVAQAESLEVLMFEGLLFDRVR